MTQIELSDEAVKAAADAMVALLQQHPMPRDPIYSGAIGILHYSGPSSEDVARAALKAALPHLQGTPFWRRVLRHMGGER